MAAAAKPGRLRWRKEKPERGLFGIGRSPLGSKLHDGVTEFASVNASGGDFRGELKGWYWVAGRRQGIPWKNTCNELCATEDEAKQQAIDYIKEYLKNATHEQTRP